MPRPSMGRQAKTVTACVKISEEEAQDMTRQYGSPGKGLRALLNQKRAQEGKR